MRNVVPVMVNVMQDYEPNPTEIPLSQIQGERFAQHAKEHDGATWESVSVNFRQWELNVNLTRDRKQGDDVIGIFFQRDPLAPFEVRRAVIAVSATVRSAEPSGSDRASTWSRNG